MYNFSKILKNLGFNRKHMCSAGMRVNSVITEKKLNWEIICSHQIGEAIHCHHLSNILTDIRSYFRILLCYFVDLLVKEFLTVIPVCWKRNGSLRKYVQPRGLSNGISWIPGISLIPVRAGWMIEQYSDCIGVWT